MGQDRRKLLEAFISTDSQGELLGCWATSYEFNPDFFQGDLLYSLFDISDGQLSRIMLEAKLRDLAYSVTVMIDAENYIHQPTSMQIALHASQTDKGSILHAKVFILIYELGIRLLVGSSNLTRQGYRENLEVATIIDLNNEHQEYGHLIRTALEEAPKRLSNWWHGEIDKLNDKALTLVDDKSSEKRQQTEWFVWSDSNERLLQRFISSWPQGAQINKIEIVSPFWSEHNTSSPPTLLIDGLAKRAKFKSPTQLTLYSSADINSERETSYHIPDSYRPIAEYHNHIDVLVAAVSKDVSKEEVNINDYSAQRSLHAKIVLIEGPDYALIYIGSANFTNRGWGCLSFVEANIEAGVILLRAGRKKHDLRALIPRVESIVSLHEAGLLPIKEKSEEESKKPWPDFIRHLELSKYAGNEDMQHQLLVTLNTNSKISQWDIVLLSDSHSIIANSSLESSNDSGLHCPLSENQFNQILQDMAVMIEWSPLDGSEVLQREFPVNVSKDVREALPFRELEELLNERYLLAYYQGKISYEELIAVSRDQIEYAATSQLEKEIGVVDTEFIQSYQIREFVESLDGIRNDLKMATESAERMRRAVNGDFSPPTLAKMIYDKAIEGKRTATAAAFQIGELLLLVEELKDFKKYPLWKHHQLLAKERLIEYLRMLGTAFPDEIHQNEPLMKYLRAFKIPFQVLR